MQSTLAAPEEQLNELRSWAYEHLLKLREACEPHLATAMAELRAYQEMVNTEEEDHEGRVGDMGNAFTQMEMDGDGLPNAQELLTEEDYPEGP